MESDLRRKVTILQEQQKWSLIESVTSFSHKISSNKKGPLISMPIKLRPPYSNILHYIMKRDWKSRVKEQLMLLKNRKKRRSSNKIRTSPQSPSSSYPPSLVPAQSIDGRVNKPERHVCSPSPFYRNPFLPMERFRRNSLRKAICWAGARSRPFPPPVS